MKSKKILSIVLFLALCSTFTNPAQAGWLDWFAPMQETLSRSAQRIITSLGISKGTVLVTAVSGVLLTAFWKRASAKNRELELALKGTNAEISNITQQKTASEQESSKLDVVTKAKRLEMNNMQLVRNNKQLKRNEQKSEACFNRLKGFCTWLKRKLADTNKNVTKLEAVNDRLRLITEGNNPKKHPFAWAIQGENVNHKDSEEVSMFRGPVEQGEYSQTLVKERYDEEDGFVKIDSAEDLLLKNVYGFRRKIVQPSLLRTNKQKIVLACVHGTFSNSDSFGSDETKKTSNATIDFAKVLSKTYGTAVEMLIFDWSGACNKDAREEAGKVLAAEINRILADDEVAVTQLWSVAHSHGCNVVNNAAAMVKEVSNRVFDVGVQIASPEPEMAFVDTDTYESPSAEVQTKRLNAQCFNFKKIYHFYGLGDFTQAAGSMQSQKTLGRKFPFRINQDHKVYNIHIKREREEANHVNIKLWVMQNLPALIHAIDTHYVGHLDLDACVFEDPIKYPLVAIRNKDVDASEVLDVMPELRQHAISHSAIVDDQFKHCVNSDDNMRSDITKNQYAVARTYRSLKNELKTARDSTI